MDVVVQERPEQPYVSITRRVPMTRVGEVLPPLTPVVFDWLGAHGVAPVGHSFWKYNVVDMAGELEVEVGVPTGQSVPGDEQVQGHVLPAGRYAVAHHVGHPDDLVNATRDLLEWAQRQELTWDVVPGDPERWTARLEEYLTDPAEQPDLSQWETNLIFLLAD